MTRSWLIDRIATRTGNGVIPASLHDEPANDPLFRPAGAVRAAVLVPLVDRSEGMTVLLTERAADLSDHAGQICFPGGRVEAHDADARAAALRETEEEIGLARHHVEVIGTLDTCLTGTGFSVVPVVGVVSPPFTLTPDRGEVAQVFEVPLAFVLNAENHHRHSLLHNQIRRHFYTLPYKQHYIWGATARMLVNLHDVLTGKC